MPKDDSDEPEEVPLRVELAREDEALPIRLTHNHIIIVDLHGAAYDAAYRGTQVEEVKVSDVARGYGRGMGDIENIS